MINVKCSSVPILWLLTIPTAFGQLPQLEVLSDQETALYTESNGGVSIHAESLNNNAIEGISLSDIGIVGESTFSYGGKFINNQKTAADVVIGGNLNGANGVISSDPILPGSSLFLRSNNSLILQLDHDNNSDAFFTLQNGLGSAVLAVGEEGDMSLAGNSNLNRPHLLITETESNDFARLRLKSTSTTDYWDIAGGAALNSQLNFYRSNIGNILQLNAFGSPITTSTGAYLSSAGVWTNAPAATSLSRNMSKAVNAQSLLAEVSTLPIYYWASKDEHKTQHLTPSSEDFYAAFGLGEDNQHLAPSDMATVALAAIQALMKENEELRQEIKEIRGELELIKIK